MIDRKERAKQNKKRQKADQSQEGTKMVGGVQMMVMTMYREREIGYALKGAIPRRKSAMRDKSCPKLEGMADASSIGLWR